MKKYISYLFCVILIPLGACFDAYDGEVDTSKYWIYFESPAVRVSEDSKGSAQTTLLLSAPVQGSDVVVPFTISSDDGLENGTDYFQSATSFTLPAGENVVVVDLLDSVANNEEALGDRSLIITLQDTDAFFGGFPGPDKNKNTIVVTIAEDDFTILGETSFEEVPTPASTTRYTRPDSEILVNNPDEPPVDHVSSGSEWGFDASYALDDRTAGDTGLENFGVVSNAAIAAVADPDFESQFVRGQQGFVSADMDGRVEILFDEVEIPDEVATLVVELSFYMNINTTFESEDGLELFYVIDGNKGEPIMSFFGDDDTRNVTDANTGERVQGEWITRVVDIPEEKWSNGRLMITMRNGADTEMIMVDYVGIKGIL